MHFLVPTFWGYFYFDPYFFILSFLFPKIKNAFYFSPYCYLTNENCLHGKWNVLFAH